MSDLRLKAESQPWKRWTLTVASSILLAGSVVLLISPQKEPEYNGKPLNHWLRLASKSDALSMQLGSESYDALHRIGTNALPWMLGWVGYERPAWKDKALLALDKLPSGIR